MPRSLRCVAEHECYHVINRANAGRLIFPSPTYCHIFLSLLEKYALKFHVRVYHYVLMPNHFHLLVEPINDDLPRFMHGLSGTYAQQVHKRLKTYGHVWQGRYKSFHIQKDLYFLRCGQYIELNPVRAGMVGDPSDYLWSSYHVYASGIPDSLVTLDQFYVDLGKTPEDRRMKYQEQLKKNSRKR